MTRLIDRVNNKNFEHFSITPITLFQPEWDTVETYAQPQLLFNFFYKKHAILIISDKEGK